MTADVKLLVRRDESVEAGKRHFEIGRLLFANDHGDKNLSGGFFLNRILRFFPGVPASGNIVHFGKSLLF